MHIVLANHSARKVKMECRTLASPPLDLACSPRSRADLALSRHLLYVTD